jgi:hypothetical protein
MGQARRAWSDDARADATICMLEAFARSRPPRVDLVAQGLEHEDEMVRWTAARLVQAVDHKGTYLPQLAAHPDALVRARSGRLQRRRDEAKPPPGKVPELARRDRPPSANDSEEESGTDPLAARSRLAPGPSKKDGPTSKPAKEVRGHPQSKVNSPYYPQTELKTVEEGTEEP